MSSSMSVLALLLLCAVAAQGYINLRVNGPMLRGSLFIKNRKITASSCALQEKCVSGTGKRKLLFFDTGIINDGNEDLNLSNSPHFEWSQCHQHYHHLAIAQYELRTTQGQVVVAGHKQSFCLEDTQRYSSNAGRSRFSCNYQGISAGWQDVYGSYLDCQFIDITGVPKGTYDICVIVNPDNLPIIRESNLRDNEECVRIQINGRKRLNVIG